MSKAGKTVADKTANPSSMPKGVEHDPLGIWTAGWGRANPSSMPKGVEHIWQRGHSPIGPGANPSSMPKGVEHKDFFFLLPVITSEPIFDAERR